MVGTIFSVAVADAENGAAFEGMTCGVFDLTALNTSTGALGVAAYWDDTNKRVTNSSSGNTLIGAFAAVKTSGPVVARVWLKP